MIDSGTQTVRDFFERANWQGLKIIEDVSLANLTPRNRAHLGLTVEEYFTLNNWQGIQVNLNENDRTQSVTAPVYSLEMSVEEFFQRMVWQGQAKVTTKPIATSPSVNNEKQTNFENRSILNLQDLSDLM